MISPRDRKKIEATFLSALEQAPEARATFVAKACAGDEALQEEVRRLLAAHREAGSYLDAPASAEIEAELARLKPEEAGERIGPYKLLQEIGEGGFGVVWMAEQEQPVRRRVALKIIKLGMDTKEVVARFGQERQALAMMDHPNIAKVFDAGATPTGRPFFVMELVRGVKFTQYCDEQELATAQRLELFITVCQAVQHAHQKGIIHRDLKPSNILVTISDGAPVPKIIDFGVAKATQGRLSEATLFTRFEQMIGTPLYMSPEQAEMTSLDIDTRSDIYSLGVLLYELLTGRTPIDQETLAKVGLDEVRRVIREVDPPRPSQRVRTLQEEERTSAAKRRQISAGRLPGVLKGDLDWIVMKCLEKDRKRRYETANGLALDLKRHLANEIISARPPTTRYLVGKLVKRHKGGVVAGGAIAAALVAGFAVSAWQAIRANREAANTAAIARFLTEDLLYQATPENNDRSKQVTMEEVLDRAAGRLEQNPDFARQPALEATLRLAIGSTYFRLGAMAEADRNLRRAVALGSKALGPQDALTLDARHELARSLLARMRDFEEGERLSKEAWQGRERLLGPADRKTLQAKTTYVAFLTNRKKLEEAVTLAREVVEVYDRAYPPGDFDGISALGDLSLVLLFRGDIAEAEECARREWERFQLRGMTTRTEALFSASNLAFYRLLLGRSRDARKLLEEILPSAVRVHGAENFVTLNIQQVLSRALAADGEPEAAAKMAQATLEARRRAANGENDEVSARLLLLLGRIAFEGGRLDEAEENLETAWKLFRQFSTGKPYFAAQAENWLGAIRLRRGDLPEAEARLLANADQLLLRTSLLSPADRRTAIEHIIELFHHLDRPEDAVLWKKRLESVQKGLNGASEP